MSSVTELKALPPTAARVAAKPEGPVELKAVLSSDCTEASTKVGEVDVVET